MNNKIYENNYEKLYASKLNDIEKNLDSFIKQKEQEYLSNENIYDNN